MAKKKSSLQAGLKKKQKGDQKMNNLLNSKRRSNPRTIIENCEEAQQDNHANRNNANNFQIGNKVCAKKGSLHHKGSKSSNFSTQL